MRIGLFFGSFNPIHIGHMIIAQSMLHSQEIDELWFVVSPMNPFKKNKSLLHEFDRMDLVDKAILEMPSVRSCDVEFQMPKPSYTIDTLVLLSEKYPDKQFKLIIGEDNLSHLHKWKNYKQILNYYPLLVYPRPNAKAPQEDFSPYLKMIEAPLLDISATFIRSNIRKGHSIKYLVPEPVEEYIHFKKFYI